MDYTNYNKQIRYFYNLLSKPTISYKNLRDIINFTLNRHNRDEEYLQNDAYNKIKEKINNNINSNLEKQKISDYEQIYENILFLYNRYGIYEDIFDLQKKLCNRIVQKYKMICNKNKIFDKIGPEEGVNDMFNRLFLSQKSKSNREIESFISQLNECSLYRNLWVKLCIKTDSYKSIDNLFQQQEKTNTHIYFADKVNELIFELRKELDVRKDIEFTNQIEMKDKEITDYKSRFEKFNEEKKSKKNITKKAYSEPEEQPKVPELEIPDIQRFNIKALTDFIKFYNNTFNEGKKIVLRITSRLTKKTTIQRITDILEKLDYKNTYVAFEDLMKKMFTKEGKTKEDLKRMLDETSSTNKENIKSKSKRIISKKSRTRSQRRNNSIKSKSERRTRSRKSKSERRTRSRKSRRQRKTKSK